MTSNLDKASAKILVLGDSGVGKSSLIHLICHSSTLSSAQWTIGCSIDVKLHNDCFLEFWDIGGSRSHKIARSFLYQDYHGIILVFDATNKKSRLNLNEWLTEVSQKTKEKDFDASVNIKVPIITIATKRDLLPQGTIFEMKESSSNFKHSSVVDFNEVTSVNNPYRRQTQSPISSSFSTFQQNLPSRLSEPTYSNYDRQLFKDTVIYVNTQDVLSFMYDTKNYEILDNFFKQVIDRRNKKFYNKFSI